MTPAMAMTRYCDARTRSGGKCRRPAGWGTPHPRRGRCKLHGGAFDDLRFEPEEVLDLGSGVTFSVVRHDARPAGSTGQVQTRQAYVLEWVDGMVVRVTVYTDIDEGRAAAERLAEERG